MNRELSRKDKIILLATIVVFVLLISNIINFIFNLIQNKSYQLNIYQVTYFIILFTSFTANMIYLLVHGHMAEKIKYFIAKEEKDSILIDQVMKTFVNFIDAKDEYTRGHSSRVANYCRALTKQLGYNEEMQQDMYYMGLMHDIGKMTVPDEILNKTSHLSADEWEVIQLHTQNGANLLKDFTIMPSLKDAVLYHHERYDGKGYLHQLKGEDIPLAARIICVADSFDAMNTNRCYRLKYSRDRIIQELNRCAGTQFDPLIAKAMIELIKNGTIESLDSKK